MSLGRARGSIARNDMIDAREDDLGPARKPPTVLIGHPFAKGEDESC